MSLTQGTRLGPYEIGHATLMPHSVPGGMSYEMLKFSAMVPTPDTTGGFEEMCMPAGEAVKSIKEIKPAAESVREMIDEARSVLRRELA